MALKMSQHYVRKTETQYKEEDVANAIQAVRSGMKIRTASKLFKVPKSTLHRRYHSEGEVKLGRRSAFNPSAEEELVQQLLIEKSRGHQLTVSEVCQLAYDFATQNNMSHPFNKDKQSAGLGWYQGFIKRHPEMRIKRKRTEKQETNDFSQIEAVLLQETISQYFNDLESILKQLHLFTKPECIYCLDRVWFGINKNENTEFDEAFQDSFHLDRRNSGNHFVFSVLSCCNGVGMFTPPFIIFKGTEKHLIFDAIPGSRLIMTSTGQVNSEILVEWIHHFQRFRVGMQVLLILDETLAHCQDSTVLDYCQERGISVICLPPNTKHYLQPLVNTFSSRMKFSLTENIKMWMTKYSGRILDEFQLINLISKVWKKVATVENACDGFQISGLYPWNPQNVMNSFADVCNGLRMTYTSMKPFPQIGNNSEEDNNFVCNESFLHPEVIIKLESNENEDHRNSDCNESVLQPEVVIKIEPNDSDDFGNSSTGENSRN